jgi:hypothetical protein
MEQVHCETTSPPDVRNRSIALVPDADAMRSQHGLAGKWKARQVKRDGAKQDRASVTAFAQLSLVRYYFTVLKISLCNVMQF